MNATGESCSFIPLLLVHFTRLVVDETLFSDDMRRPKAEKPPMPRRTSPMVIAAVSAAVVFALYFMLAGGGGANEPYEGPRESRLHPKDNHGPFETLTTRPPLPPGPAQPEASIQSEFAFDRPLSRDAKPLSRLCWDREMFDEKSPLLPYLAPLNCTFPHRKFWEFAAIAHALDKLGVVKRGTRGIGFGCGVEPLASFFVNQGSDVVVSDAPAQGEWARTNQHSQGLEMTRHKLLIDSNTYAKHASFRAIDMNNLPKDVTSGKFDFVYSGGALEHVGGEAKSIAFIMNSLQALKPGGVAAHTTEFVISSDSTRNVNVPWMTVFTKTVWTNLLKRIEDAGYEVIGPMNYGVGQDPSPIDWGRPYRAPHHFNLVAYREHPHNKDPFVHTSVLLLVRKPADFVPRPPPPRPSVQGIKMPDWWPENVAGSIFDPERPEHTMSGRLIKRLNAEFIDAAFRTDRPAFLQPDSAPISRLCWDKEVTDPASPLQKYRFEANSSVVHRKYWEFASIAHALDKLGVLRPGAKGVGFGCGKEPLAPLFAKRGCNVLLSDAPSSGQWGTTTQHAESLKGAWFPQFEQIISFADFGKKTTFMPADMNALPPQMTDGSFDFTWSAGSFEHVGGQKLSVGFFLNQLKALKPGGVAAHTTEFVISTATAPQNVECGHMTVFTKPVLEAMLQEVRSAGYEVIGPMDYGVGSDPSPLDSEPYSVGHHFNLLANDREGHRFAHTSVLIVVRRPPQ